MTSNLMQSCCALLLAATGGFLLAQDPPVPGIAPAPVVAAWPPDPAERIINLAGEELFSKRNRDQVIYTVPEDFWLVVTDFRRQLPPTTTVDPDLDLVMRPAGSKRDIVVIPHQLSDSVNMGSAVGLKFPPKSEVVLHRNAELSGDLASLYMLTGYLAPAAPPEKGSRR